MYEDKKNYYRANPPTSRYRHNVDDALGLADLDTLRRAVAEKRFEVYLQPKVSFQDRSLRGAEALVRYRNQDGSIEVPDQFIPALEEARLIYYLDFYMFNFVCREIRTWLEQGYRVVPVAVNFSRYTFLERNYVEKLLDIWKKYDIPQSLLEIEITESVGNVDSDYLLKIINDIRAAGFAVAIDDFGVKYANLSLFKSVDIDTLKLDRSMIGQLTESRKSRILIQSLSQICKSMHTQLVVEGVETEEQFFILRELGCDCAQGFLFGKPMPVEQYVSWLSKHRSKD